MFFCNCQLKKCYFKFINEKLHPCVCVEIVTYAEACDEHVNAVRKYLTAVTDEKLEAAAGTSGDGGRWRPAAGRQATHHL